MEKRFYTTARIGRYNSACAAAADPNRKAVQVEGTQSGSGIHPYRSFNIHSIEFLFFIQRRGHHINIRITLNPI